MQQKQKTAAYYRTRASELDTKVLNTIPECPRGAKEPNSFDWCMLSSAEPTLMSNGLNNKKSRDKSDNGNLLQIINLFRVIRFFFEGNPAKIVMPDNKKSNSEEKLVPEPPQEEATHVAEEQIEMQENVDVNGHQEPEEINKSIEGELSFSSFN